MKVSNITGVKGNKIANQFIIRDDNGIEYFQSYKSIIAKVSNGQVYLDEFYHNYSRTTSKYRNLFLGLNSKQIEDKIKNSEFILTNLNG
jgi:hypothetical protein